MTLPEELQALAETWIQGTSEPEWRSAVSRAYYGVFHKARQLLRAIRFRVPRGDQAHGYLWLRLSNCGDAQVKSAGSALNALRTDRNFADYDIDRDLPHADAQRQVVSARRILHLLDNAAIEPTRSNITDAMKIYEKNVLTQVTWTP